MKKYFTIIVLLLLAVSLYGVTNTAFRVDRVYGGADPSVIGTYTVSGTFNGVPCYNNASWWLWWKSDWQPGVYLVSKNKGDTAHYWIALIAGKANTVMGIYTNDMIETRGSLSVTNAP